jgi:3-deoxy-D-manno-octulosonic-acid transferase
MAFVLDAAYLLFLGFLSPWLVYKAITTGKYRRGLVAKFLGSGPPVSHLPRAAAWFHAVSVGEIHLLRPVIAVFRRHHPEVPCVVSTTTDTGYDEAQKVFADLSVFWFPLDFSWAVRRVLRRLAPSVLVLAEGELWPNLLLAARRQGVPVAVINARMSPRSLRRYQRLAAFARPLLRLLNLIAAQTEEYARAFRALGVERHRVQATGSVKFDGVNGNRENGRTVELRSLFGIQSSELVWVAGSTQSPEEEIVLRIYDRVRATCPQLRLLVVPRQKDRFEEVARLVEGSGLSFVRRSALRPESEIQFRRRDVTVVDTIGELGAIWGLADVAYVGGSLDGKRGGQNMIEPAAYGAAVVFGPHVWNFRDTARRLLEAGAARQVADEEELESVVRELLASQSARTQSGDAARAFVMREQGATERTVMLLGTLLAHRNSLQRVA